MKNKQEYRLRSFSLHFVENLTLKSLTIGCVGAIWVSNGKPLRKNGPKLLAEKKMIFFYFYFITFPAGGSGYGGRGGGNLP